VSKAERVVLVDGSSLIFRAYFAIPGNLTSPEGLPTNAILGFTNMFRKLFAGKRPAFGAVAFDVSAPTFRSKEYPEYKAHRSRMPDDLRVQLPYIDKVVAAFGFPAVRMPGYEADDVIGTLTREAVEAGHDVVIVSSDKDFAQLIGPSVRMFDSMRDVTYDVELARKKWGVQPEQFIDYLALLGDKVDNIPGVPGIGKKGATTLLEAHGSLDAILATVETLKGRAKKALTEHRELALLSRTLATIDQHVPLETGLKGLSLPDVDPEDLNTLYRELGFYSLLSDEARASDAATGNEADYVACTDPADAQAALEAALKSSDGGLSVIPLLDTTETQPKRRSLLQPRLCGLAFAGAAGAATYVPLAERAFDAPEWAFLREWIEDAGRPKYCHDAKELWVALRRQGVTLSGVAFDTRLASFLIDPTKLIPHRLEQTVKEFLHRTVHSLKSVVGSGKKEIPFSDAPLADASAYACHLVDAIAELAPLVKTRLDDSGQTATFTDVDLPLSWVLGEMEFRGVLVDSEDLAALGKEFGARLEGIVSKIHALAGRAFNVNSTKQLSTVLFEELKLPVIKRTKTGYSTNVEVLTRLAKEHPIAKLILEQRQLAKLINTYTDVLGRSVHPETGRVHPTFQQTSGATGRLISTDPDLQRTPVRTTEGERIRRCFVAADGHRILAADWSQIELRLLAHVSKDPLLCQAFRDGIDVHAQTAGKLFNCASDDVSKDQRRIGKTINFATTYGQGATALAQILEIPRKDAKRYIEDFFAAFAGVRAWIDDTVADAIESGYVTTLAGRKRIIPELASHNPMIRMAGTRIAANTPLQGSVADICKLAMLGIDARIRADGLGAVMLMQIHDELVFEVPEGEVDALTAICKDVMETVVSLDVPLIADVGVGHNWSEAH
jgi:DNA polymerase I